LQHTGPLMHVAVVVNVDKSSAVKSPDTVAHADQSVAWLSESPDLLAKLPWQSEERRAGSDDNGSTNVLVREFLGAKTRLTQD
jgi:hypothetical protein